MPTPTTPGRGYKQPDPANLLSQDVLRIADALLAIDADMVTLLSAIGTLDLASAKLTGNQIIAGIKTFTSSPVVPDLPVGENSTKAVNAKFVQAAVAALVNSSPAALDTLNELAAALGNDPNFATTITNALASKADAAATSTALAAKADAADTATALAAKASNADLMALLPTGLGPLPWSLPTLPSGGWAWADGSVLLSSTQYPALRTLYINAGFPYGQDGSGNPKMPDMRGRVPAGKDDMGGTAANRLTSGGSGIAGATLGAAGGAETHTLTSAQIPAHTHTGTADSAGAHSHTVTTAGGVGGSGLSTTGQQGGSAATSSAGAHTHTLTINANTGGGQAHNNTQPTLVINYIVKT